MKNNINNPFLLVPVGKDYIWGGDRLKYEYGKNFINLSPLAETWECSTHSDGECIVGSGIFKGEKLSAILRRYPRFLGINCKSDNGKLPILIKLIDAKQDLSVQVHPTDDYAWKFENHQSGKSEMWYVLEAEEGASLVCGVNKNITAELIKQAAVNGYLNNYLNKINVRKGDAFFIEAGTIHAIGKGMVIAEIQQTSNLTYRLYDYNRIDKNGKKRLLHLNKAISVAKLEPGTTAKLMKVRIYEPNICIENLIKSKYFKVTKYIVNGRYNINASEYSFKCLLVVEGAINLTSSEGFNCVVTKGETYFIPASNITFDILGRGVFLVVMI